ncbi:MAG: polyprenyl synthetase family protein [Lachnospiraceae bacterium]|nr:polyprenyl synthetase family protein [Butyrivibrio sp.]MCM1345109.1 polyprenyl synthetase family protein [Muribaculaceae bacterium]MCM1412279.1 polyprenyl synthetase family protein [Lachnospiraceae bacterium]
MGNKEAGQYYNLIMGDSQDSFKNYFEKEWNRFIDSFPTRHKKAIQLRIGNRLRPCLVCWGYALSAANIEKINFRDIIDLAIGMELIHKGSLIIDDYIDDDDARRGKITFHKEYSSNEAIMFLLYLLGKAVGQLGKYEDLECISRLICSMSEGALQELSLTHDDLFQSVKIDDIVKGETVTLIRDSLLYGYKVNRDDISEISQVLESVAGKCAYNFQLLNDLEPFSGMDQNIEYKKNHNFDLEKNRKNMVIARLYQICTEDEKDRIMARSTDGKSFRTIYDLIVKYEIRDGVIRDVENAKAEIDEELLSLSSLINNVECLHDFLYFIHETIDLCYLRI